MCDCAEELEQREIDIRQSSPAPSEVEPSHASSWWGFQWWEGSGEGESTSKEWVPILGSTAALMGLLALIYKNIDKLKTLIWKTKTCETKIVKRKPSTEKIKLCICKD